MSELTHKRAYRLIQQAHLSGQEKSALKTHLDGCEACQQFAAMHVYLTEHLQLEPARGFANSAFRATLLSKFRSQQRSYQIMKSVKVLAVAAILVVVSLWFFINSSLGPVLTVEQPAAKPTATLNPTSTPILPLASSPEDILGIWDNQNNLFLYLENGTYHGVSRNIPRHGAPHSRVEDDPDWWGEYWFEGTQLFLQETGQAEGVPPCAETIIGIHEVRMLENGHLDYVMIDDKCAFRRMGLSGNHESRP